MDREADGQKYERSQQEGNNIRHDRLSDTIRDTPIRGGDRLAMDGNPEDDI